MNYKSPILATVYKILAVIVLVGGIGGGLLASNPVGMASGILAGVIGFVIAFGLAEVIDLIGKTAYHSEQTAINTLALVARPSVAPVAVHSSPQIQTPLHAAPARRAGGAKVEEPKFFLHQGGHLSDPVTLTAIKEMRQTGKLASDAQFCQEGTNEWMGAEDFFSLHDN